MIQQSMSLKYEPSAEHPHSLSYPFLLVFLGFRISGLWLMIVMWGSAPRTSLHLGSKVEVTRKCVSGSGFRVRV